MIIGKITRHLCKAEYNQSWTICIMLGIHCKNRLSYHRTGTGEVMTTLQQVKLSPNLNQMNQDVGYMIARCRHSEKCELHEYTENQE